MMHLVPGGEKEISQKEETRIVALVCSDPPESYDRWSVRLLTEEVKSRKIVDSIINFMVRKKGQRYGVVLPFIILLKMQAC
jgi:hypothetical protein